MDSTATSQISGKSFEKSMLVGAEVFFVWLKKKKSRANTTHKLVLHVASTPPNERRAKLSTGERERAQSASAWPLVRPAPATTDASGN